MTTLRGDWDLRFRDAMIEAITTSRRLSRLYVRRRVEAQLGCADLLHLGAPGPTRIRHEQWAGLHAYCRVPFTGPDWLFDAAVDASSQQRPLYGQVEQNSLLLAVECDPGTERMVAPLLASELNAIEQRLQAQRLIIQGYNQFVSEQARGVVTDHWGALVTMQALAFEQRVHRQRRELAEATRLIVILGLTPKS